MTAVVLMPRPSLAQRLEALCTTNARLSLHALTLITLSTGRHHIDRKVSLISVARHLTAVPIVFSFGFIRVEAFVVALVAGIERVQPRCKLLRLKVHLVGHFERINVVISCDACSLL